MADTAPSSEPPKLKRSLFKRPTWAAQSTTNKPESPETSTTTLFDRSDHFDRNIAERERKKRERAEKKSLQEEKKAILSQTQPPQSSPDARSEKRRRISDLDDELLANEESISQRYNDAPSATKPQTRWLRDRPNVIELDESDDEDHDLEDNVNISHSRQESVQSLQPRPQNQSVDPLILSPSPPPPTIQPSPGPDYPPEDDSESDAELAEIKRDARAKRRLEEQAAKDRQNATITHGIYGSSYMDNYPAPPPDPAVQLFVTSPIPGTKPLIVTRKMSQRLQEVKDAWCARQIFPPEFLTSSIFFTYRLRKLYNVTTCKSLGVKVDSEGKVIPDEKTWDDDGETGVGGEHEGKIHLEAVTEELWLKLKAARRSGRNGSSFLNKTSTDQASGENTPMAAGEATDKEPIIRITFKAKGFKDIKMKTKPSTTFAKMASAARRLFSEQSPIAPNQTLILSFDGEALEPPEGQIKDTEIEDMERIDVYIK
ncbi:hypothetical protein BDV97DRAFT_395829 [Delphinella strobiligena]|nr:hypothetical protein BDV97DRAFT_395829 [Delphinella strobiligena]